MGTLKTYVLRSLCVLAALLAANIAVALPQSADERIRVFAACTGRLSATMEHQWLVSDPSADETQALRQYFVTLLDASLETGTIQPRHALHLRIEAKMAHARLLQQSTFAPDARVARQANRIATRYMAGCRALLLS